eukprot:3339616-Pyramimonas_sp.AAC.1
MLRPTFIVLAETETAMAQAAGRCLFATIDSSLSWSSSRALLCTLALALEEEFSIATSGINGLLLGPSSGRLVHCMSGDVPLRRLWVVPHGSGAACDFVDVLFHMRVCKRT